MVSNLTIETAVKPPETARELADVGQLVGGWDAQTCTLLSVNPDLDFRDLSPNCIGKAIVFSFTKLKDFMDPPHTTWEA